jgi:hypothetical protein
MMVYSRRHLMVGSEIVMVNIIRGMQMTRQDQTKKFLTGSGKPVAILNTRYCPVGGNVTLVTPDLQTGAKTI